MSIIGFTFALFSFSIGIYYIFIKLIDPTITPGLSSTVLFITFFSGLNLIGLGLLGEYVGRIYDEVKNRPNFIIDKNIILMIKDTNQIVKKNIEFFSQNKKYQKDVNSIDTYKILYEKITQYVKKTNKLLDIGHGGTFDYDTGQINEIIGLDLIK